MTEIPGWPAVILTGLALIALGNPDDLTGRAIVALGAFATLVAAFAGSILAVGYLPCLRLAWPLVAGVDRGLGRTLQPPSVLGNYQARAGFAILDRNGGAHHVGAFRYGLMPVSPKSRLLTEAEAAVTERRVAAEPGLTATVERPWGRLAVLALGPALMLAAMGGVSIFVS